MIDDRYFLEPAAWSVDAAELLALRNAVFAADQGIAREEADADDPAADHVLARTRDGLAIGCGRLTQRGELSRMAVLPQWRGQGVGAALLRHLIERAQSFGLRRLSLHANAAATEFYARFGFATSGAPFEALGIVHQAMQLELPQPLPHPALLRPAVASDSKRLTATRASELHDALLQLIEGAKHELCLYTRDFDPPVLSQIDISDAVRRVALSGRMASIKILLQDSTRAAREGHRLVDLAQRLSSLIRIRTPSQDDLGYAGAFAVNDQGGFLYRPFGDRYEAEGDLHYAPRRDELKRYFDDVWERAEPTAELRRL